MLLIGAKGHAKEVIDVLDQCGQLEGLLLFDDVSVNLPGLLYGKFKILRTADEAVSEFTRDNRFVLALGNPLLRYKLSKKFVALGGVLTSVVSPRSRVGSFDVCLGEGLNIMTGAVVGNSVSIGEGSLLNANCTIHHDSVVGAYCEVSPGAHITGRCRIGDFSSVGAGAVLLPGITLGNNVVVGAGAVVTNDVPDATSVAGVPAKLFKPKAG